MWGFVWGCAPRPTRELSSLDLLFRFAHTAHGLSDMDCAAIHEGGKSKNLRFLVGFGAKPQKAPSVTFHEKRLDFNCGLSFIIRGVSVKHL